MSLFPAFVNARKRQDDSAPLTDAESDSHAGDSRAADSDDNVFNLLPPETAESAPEPKPVGRNRHPVDMTDLSRLSIDRDGRLYWDGKPVEVHRRLMMSRAQIVGASILAIFVVIGALGAALQGSMAARDWACRMGWLSSSCSLPARPHSDIPA